MRRAKRKIEQSIRRYFERRQEGCTVLARWVADQR
jgi:hypothetical protein